MATLRRLDHLTSGLAVRPTTFNPAAMQQIPVGRDLVGKSKHTKRMTHLLKTMAAFALGAGINTASVALQLRTGLLTRRYADKAWYVHLAVVTPGWLLFLYLVSTLGRHRGWPLPDQLRPAGILLLVLSSALWIWTFTQLGAERTANANIFGRGPDGPVDTGPFRYLENPMYDSYLLAFAGLALWKADARYLLLALESYLLLNLVEASVENRAIKERGNR